MYSIALPKGRLAEKTCALLTKLGYLSASGGDTRKLIFEDSAHGIRYFFVKPSDVPVYVEYGVADLGVVGKDILLENNPTVYELLDLNMGKCRICVAAPKGFVDDSSRPLRVATTFVNIASEYFASANREVEIIKLNGSVELAPLLNMTDVIVDLVETGTTLRENNLEIIKEIMPISARLIANKASYKFKGDSIDALVADLKGELGSI